MTSQLKPLGNQQGNEVTASVTMAEFLMSQPPGGVGLTLVSGAWRTLSRAGSANTFELTTPPIELHCGSAQCGGQRIFRHSEGDDSFGRLDILETFITYRCSNCRESLKRFALFCKRSENGSAHIYKFGELPQFGVPTPPKLLDLLGSDRETFLRGRRCEFQGLGVGAFAYYRRVVENQKNAILDEVARVAKAVGAPSEIVTSIEAAKAEIQFKKALKTVSVPPSLLIRGHNPLQMLHTALSEGLHGKTDAECLELAHDTRVVLAELAERIGQAMKDDAELSKSVAKLMSKVGPAP